MRSFLREGLHLLPVALIGGASPVGAAAQALPDSAAGLLEVHRLAEGTSIHLDGILGEDVWAAAPAADDLRQQEPEEGAPASERTEVRVLYDDESLYIGIRAFDSEPDQIVGRILQRDQVMDARGVGLTWGGDDAVAILLDPFHDHRNAVVLATNPNGAEFDALITDEGREINVSWRGIWEVAGSRTPDGWSAEFRIPFRSLRYPENGGQPWGFNVYRTVSRKNEDALWRSWSRDNAGFERVSLAGHLVGLTELPRPGLTVEAKPYVLTGTRQVRDDDGELPTDGELDMGLDIKSEVRPGLVLDLTVNTDFAQVEVDDEQVNLTRFDLFFPEKRDFFLENSGIFDLGLRGFGGPPSMLMFFSRRIGVGEAGPVPMLGGARLTGRSGDQTVGFMNVVTGEEGAVPRESFTVARVKRDLGDADFVGLMVTDRRRVGALPDELETDDDPGLPYPANTVVGVDGSWWLSERLQFLGFATRSFTQGAGGDDNAYHASLDYTADRFGFILRHLTVEPELMTRSGFTLRTDLRQTQTFLRFSPRISFAGLRRVVFRTNGLYQSRVDGAFQDWNAGLTVQPEWASGDQISLSYTPGETRVDEPFRLAGQAPIPAGRYRADELRWRASTTESRSISVSHMGQWEETFGGDIVSLTTRLRVVPDPRLQASFAFSRNEVTVPSGAFVANVGSLRLDGSLSTHMSANVLFQYNSLQETFSTNFRFNFIHRPGSDLFVVLSEGRGYEEDLWRVKDRGLALKLTWLQRF